MLLEFVYPTVDGHTHVRDDTKKESHLLPRVIHHTAAFMNAAVIMPNLNPDPVLTAEDAIAYHNRVCQAVSAKGIDGFSPLMTFKITPNTTPEMVRELAELPYIVAGKLYPDGVTTNSEGGVTNFFALYDVYKAMEECGLVLCIHGEMPGKQFEGLERETAFIPTIEYLAATFPRLRIVMEHITTAKAAKAVLRMPSNVAATITVHHLLLTHDDVGGDKCSPLHFCKPVAKSRRDRDELVRAATSGCPKFLNGSDSAPHPLDGKQRLEECCAGVFNAPVQIPLLVNLFEQRGALGQLPFFLYHNMKNFYRLSDDITKPERVVRVVKQDWEVPELIDGVAPLWRGKVIPWQVKS